MPGEFSPEGMANVTAMGGARSNASRGVTKPNAGGSGSGQMMSPMPIQTPFGTINPRVMPPTAAPGVTASPAGAAGGGAPGAGVDPNFLGGYAKQFTDAASGAVKGYGDMVGQDLKKQVGSILGGLQGIGGLRSGAAPQAINDAMMTYGRQVGDYASMTANNALNSAANENNNQVERNERTRERNDSANKSNLGTLGKVIGGITDMIPGGGVIKGVGSILSSIF